MPGRPEHLLLVAVLLAVAVGPVLAGFLLLANGVTMIRRESLRPGNLLSLVAGMVVFAVIGLDIVAGRAGEVKLSLFATAATLVSGYVSFLLVSYVCYAFVYGLVARAGGADFVVVLGSGLRPDGSVPPLLASRLERGRAVWAALDRRAADFRPVLARAPTNGAPRRPPWPPTWRSAGSPLNGCCWRTSHAPQKRT